MSETLFIYASREGHTRRICEAMAAEASATRILEVSDPAAVTALAQCGRVVMGASIHYGRLPAEVYRFIAKHRALLEARQNAFFCINLTARKPGKDTPQGSAYMRRFLKTSAWVPQRLAVFAGALVYTRYDWFDREVIRLIMRITGGPTDASQDYEFTDWARVRAVAREWLAE